MRNSHKDKCKEEEKETLGSSLVETTLETYTVHLQMFVFCICAEISYI